MDSIKAKFDLTGKVAVITGANKGIGEAIAFGLAEHGAKVVLSSRKQETVEEVCSRISENQYFMYCRCAHAGSAGDLEIVQSTMNAYGRIDIVVNNAAANPVFGPLTKCGEDAFNKIMEVNVQGTL